MKSATQILLTAVLLLATLSHCTRNQALTQPNPGVPYLSSLEAPSDFSILKGAPLSMQYTQVDAIKLVYDLQTSALYFINARQYRFHFDFCSRYLNYPNDLNAFNAVEYGLRGKRRFLLANLNFYNTAKVYTLEFFSDDRISTAQLATVFDAVARSVYFRETLFVLANANLREALSNFDPAHILSVDQVFGKQQYQPMVFEKAYGYLRKVGKADFENHQFSSRDIILTDFLPNDLPFCQGILTTAFQTPLAHINILSHNRKTPNCAFKSAWQDPAIQALTGQLVCYEVRPDTFFLSAAEPSVAQAFWDAKYRRPTRKLNCDLREKNLLDVQRINRHGVATVGAKAANFGELDKIKLPDHSKIPLPEGAFAIPFFYYQQHIRQHGLQPHIDALLRHDSIAHNRTLLHEHLKALRDSISAKPLDSRLLQLVNAKLKACPGGYTEFRFRSSTNAEDIPGFTGAGLYASKTGSLVRPDKSIEKAIKKVWASLWSPRAFEERLYAHIDQSNLAMGILVHRAFGTEEANGVAITRNLYRSGYPACTVNIQKGEDSVVLPENEATPEQFLLKYAGALTGGDDIAVDYISHSSLNNFEPLLRPEEIQVLADYLYAIKKHFYYASGHVVLGPNFFDFAMDVEFKLDKGSRKIYVKQARPY
ncbi:MAG: hypothetical protein IT260_14210 [Saprospiraceae bacterium]|nr:hypothetical protein [Saprospiraceae bacterium]